MTIVPELRIGEGWDVHALVAGRPLVLGGVVVPHTQGLAGHSDADALLHAITDALLGAVAWATSAAISPTPTRRMPVPTRHGCWPRRFSACANVAGRW